MQVIGLTYFLYCTLVIVLANDIEQNPGPFTLKSNDLSILQGNFHQGSENLDSSIRGKQCVCNSLVFMVYSMHSLMTNCNLVEWTSNVLDSIIYAGSDLYLTVVTKKQFANDYLLFSELPSNLLLESTLYTTTITQTYSGLATPSFQSNHGLFNLQVALQLAFESTKQCLFVVHSSAIGLLQHNDEYYVYDSHSRNSVGLMSPNGTSCLLKLTHLHALTCFLYSLTNSLNENNATAQFDLTAFSLTVEQINEERPQEIYTLPTWPYNSFQHMTDQNLFPTFSHTFTTSEINVQPNDEVFSQESSVDFTHSQHSVTLNSKQQHTVGTDSFKKDDFSLNLSDNVSSRNECTMHTNFANMDAVGKVFLQSLENLKIHPQLVCVHDESNICNHEMPNCICKWQNTCMCISYLVYFRILASQFHFQDASVFETILSTGTDIYKSVFKQHIKEMKLADIPKYFVLNDKHFSLKIQHLYTTSANHHKCTELGMLPLSSPLTLGLLKSPCLILEVHKHVLLLIQVNNTNFVFIPKCNVHKEMCGSQLISYVVSSEHLNDIADYIKELTNNICDNTSNNHLLMVSSINLKEITKGTFVRQNKKGKGLTITKRPASPTQNLHENIPHKKPYPVTEKEFITDFHTKIQQGPIFVCVSCEQLWYKRSVYNFDSVSNNIPHGMSSCIQNIQSPDNNTYICHTCYVALSSNKIPTCCTVNGLQFEQIPVELQDLYPLEERLVALRIPFMQIRDLPCGRQLNLKGNVVNVPANVANTISTLPRTLNTAEIITLKLKRKLEYCHDYLFDNIRPAKVLAAAKWLIENSQLYQEENITLQTSNLLHELNANDLENQSDETAINSNENMASSDDEFCENDKQDLPTGIFETLLDNDFPQDVIPDKILSYAPGEGNNPLGIFQDKYCEELSFPTLFCGQPRPKESAKVHYSNICKRELRHRDRRHARSISNIFFKLKKLQIQHIQMKVQFCLRRCRVPNNPSAGFLKQPGTLETLVTLDEGFKILKNLRGSPPYWQKAQRDLFAMIRQLGLPTWFMSFSAAETKWSHLLQMLAQINQNKSLTIDQVNNLNWQQKSELIRSDPVTCARHFHSSFETFLSSLQSSHCPVGKIADFFYRIEFQHRGSPHVHMLIWIDNAPNLSNDSYSDIENFIDKYIKCSSTSDNSTLNKLIPYQSHKHSRTCKKKGNKCRFSFPIPPMNATRILTPLQSKEQNIKTQAISNHKKIMSALNEMKHGEEISFTTFLKKLDMTHNCYIQAIRSSLHRPTIFLQRQPSDIRINGYNSTLLQAWQANMDIQFVLDPYACAMYIVSYISKSQRGMSNLLAQAVQEAQEGNTHIKQRVRHIGNKFLNNVEISAQEAVYYILQLPFRKSSRQVVFIDTNPPEKKFILLKPLKKIQEMNDNDHNVECDNVLNKYSRRPKPLETLCLADLVSWYDFSYVDTNFPNNEHNSDEEQPLQDENTGNSKYFRTGNLVYKKRNKQKVIRFVNFKKGQDLHNHYRELLLLFYPWRKQDDILGSTSCFEQRYRQLKSIIEMKRLEYTKEDNVILENVQDIFENNDNDPFPQHIVPQVTPNTGFQDHELSQITPMISETFSSFLPTADNQAFYDIGQDIGVAINSEHSELWLPSCLPDNEYLGLVHSLNIKQQEIFFHILKSFKTQCEPLYLFITGGAGVGKSRVLKAIFQSLQRHFVKNIQENPDTLKIILTAPTGKAAYNIKGTTIHSALNIPVSQGFKYQPLTSEKLNTLRTKLKDLKVMIIDEISMVGNSMLLYIHLRLQSIMHSDKPFGGVSILAFGDFYQLKPVFDNWIFNDLTRNYGALATNLWTHLFNMFELDEIMRQKNDQNFAKLLNRLREGQHTANDVETLRTCHHSNSTLHKNSIYLFTTNKQVENFNEIICNALPGTKYIAQSVDIVVGDVTETVKQTILNYISLDPRKTMGLHKHLKLVQNLRVEITLNVRINDGLINGASGYIAHIDLTPTNDITLVWVMFDDKETGKLTRQENAGIYHNCISKSWTPIQRIKRQFQAMKKKTSTVLRQQFPLRPAAAKTIHRCQGDTLPSATIDLSGSRIQAHMHYVALSRVTNLTGLKLINLNEHKIHVDKAVHNEMKRLRNVKAQISNITQLHTLQNALVIVFHNARSLHKNIKSLQTNINMTNADVICIAETRLQSNDNSDDYHIQNFTCIRFDSNILHNNKRSPYGLAIYTKHDLLFSKHVQTLHAEFAIVKLQMCNTKYTIISLYKYINSSMIPFLLDLKTIIKNYCCPSDIITVLGDFNASATQREVQNYLLANLQIHFTQIINEETTNYNTTIDHIYTNSSLPYDQGTLESHTSDHKPIFIAHTLCLSKQ